MQEELFESYEEQERNYDIQNITNNMSEYSDSDMNEQLERKTPFIEEAADLSRTYNIFRRKWGNIWVCNQGSDKRYCKKHIKLQACWGVKREYENKQGMAV